MQCTKVASKARSALGMIRRHFKTIDAEEFHIHSYIRMYGVLCPGMVAISLKGHRVSGEDSDECNKNGEGYQEDGV